MMSKVKIAIVIILIIVFFMSSKKLADIATDTQFSPNTRIYSPQVFAGLKDAYSNKYAIASMLATILRESDFKPQSEGSYKNTSAFRIRKIFPSKFENYSDAQIDALKKDDVKFFNHVYGGRYGNAANEGYKYRGRGLNQITFKGNYQMVADNSNIDAVNNPDSLNELGNAVKAFVVYMEYTKKNLLNSGDWSKWGFPKSLDKADSLEQANKMLLKLNVGKNASYDSEYYKHLTKWAPKFLSLIDDTGDNNNG
jgi:predicted chitinase